MVNKKLTTLFGKGIALDMGYYLSKGRVEVVLDTVVSSIEF
jgi:hypothetical protein